MTEEKSKLTEQEQKIIDLGKANDRLNKYVIPVTLPPILIAIVLILSVVLTFLAGAVIDYLRQITVEPLILKGFKTPKASRWLAAIDGAMPKNGVTAEEGTKPSPAPGLALLCAAALYFGCKVVQVYTQKEIAFKLFLVIAVVITVILLKLRHSAPTK